MAYAKHTWSSNELITATQLNHMEDGIEAVANNSIIADSIARTIVAGTNSYNITNLTSDHVVACWQFSGNYSESNPPADITVTTSNGSYTITASNLFADGITMKPIFIKPY